MLINTALWQDFSRLSRLLKQSDVQPCDYYRLVSDYCGCCCRLATRLALQRNSLLQEWCLRYALFTLADAATDTSHSADQKRICADMLYMPLIALTRLYRCRPEGKAELAALHAKLRYCFACS